MSTNQSIQIPEDVSLRELPSDAADLSVYIETCGSAIFALSETLRKTEKDLSAKAGRGIGDNLELIHQNLMMANDEAKNLAVSLGDIVPAISTKGMKTICFSIPDKHYDIVEKIVDFTGEDLSNLATEAFYACMENELVQIVDGRPVGDILGFGEQLDYEFVFQEGEEAAKAK